MSALLPTPSRPSEPAGAGPAVALARGQAEPGAAEGTPTPSFDAVLETVTVRKPSAGTSAKDTTETNPSPAEPEVPSPAGKAYSAQKSDAIPRAPLARQGIRRAKGGPALEAVDAKASASAEAAPTVTKDLGAASPPAVAGLPGKVEATPSDPGAAEAVISSNPTPAAPAATSIDLMGAVMGAAVAPTTVDRPAVLPATGGTNRPAMGATVVRGTVTTAMEMRVSVLVAGAAGTATPRAGSVTLEIGTGQGLSRPGTDRSVDPQPQGRAAADGLTPGLQTGSEAPAQPVAWRDELRPVVQTAGKQVTEGAGVEPMMVDQAEPGVELSLAPQSVTGPAQPDAKAPVSEFVDFPLATGALAGGNNDILQPIHPDDPARVTAFDAGASSPAQPSATAAPEGPKSSAPVITAPLPRTSARDLLVNQGGGSAVAPGHDPAKSEQFVAPPERPVLDKSAVSEAAPRPHDPVEQVFSVPSAPRPTVSESQASSASDLWPRETTRLSAGQVGMGGGGTAEGTGTGGAKTSPQMTKTEENDGVTPGSGHFLPSASAAAEDSAPGIPVRTATRANVMTADADTFRSSPTTMPTALSGSNFPIPTTSVDATRGPEIIRNRPALELGALQAQISNWAVDIKRSGTASMDVVVRPNEQTEVALRLSVQDGAVVVSAECTRGNWEALGAQWGQLQESLSGKGIQLGALEPAQTLELLGQGATGGFNSFNRPAGEAPEYAEAFVPKPFLSAGSGSFQPSTAPRVATAKGRWESWA